MKTWRRSPVEERCGLCSATIPAGAPFLAFTFPTVKAQKLRCARLPCAGEPVPVALPATITKAAPPPLDMTRLGLLALDFSRREPGEEG